MRRRSRFIPVFHAMPTDATISTADAPAIGGESCSAPLPPGSSECPPQLMWADVLARVEQGVRETRIGRAGGVVTVRSFGEGRPLYVLPGGLGDWRLFSLTMWLLRDEFRMVVVDPPEWSARQRLSPEEAAADLFAAADRLGDASFSLFATSLGALPALQAMLERPSRIERAILHAADSRLRLSAAERMLTSLGRFTRRPLAAVPFFNRIQLHNHRRWFPPFDASRWEFFLANVGRTPARGLCRRLGALRAADFTRRLREIATPILLLRCEGEGAASTDRVEQLRAALPDAGVRFLPHCGHYPFLTHPHVLAKAVREFVVDPFSRDTK
jgi:pimeloyl-[acyl-carrier protein] methyl ester esterase